MVTTKIRLCPEYIEGLWRGKGTTMKLVVPKEVISMVQKIIKVGNSTALIIPKSVMEEMGFTVGEKMKLTTTRKPIKIEFVPVHEKKLSKKSGITASFTKSVDEFINTYKPALEELAKR